MLQKNDLLSVDAIIFDLGGVVLNLDYQLTINAFKSLGKENFEALYAQAQQNKIFDAFETGQLSAAEFIDYLKQFLPDVKEDQQIISAWNAMLLDLPPHRIQLLEKLRNHYQLFLLSNTNEIHYQSFRETLQNRFGDLELLEKSFEKTYYSHKIEKRKPNADAFEMVLGENQLKAENTLFIDDTEQHILGAREVGIRTYHLKNEDILDIFS
ncbi:MAG: HAD family phosphatase [Crocinitomicaceae bacterium]